MNKPNTKNYTLCFSKNFGKLWMLDDVTPFPKKFQTFFTDDMGHDFLKLTACGAENRVLDILASGETEMRIDLVVAEERLNMPGYVEFELVEAGKLAAKYYVNNIPNHPQFIAWPSNTVKTIIRAYPAFAYIKKA